MRARGWIAAGVGVLAATGAAVGLFLGLGGSNGPSAADVVRGDGYTQVKAFDHAQLVQAVNKADKGAAGGDITAALFDNGAYGWKGMTGMDSEVVFELTPQGEQLFGDPAMRAMFASSVAGSSTYVHMDAGRFLTLSGPEVRWLPLPEGQAP